MNLPRYRRSQGWEIGPLPPTEIPRLIKIIITKPYIFSVLVFFAFSRTTVYVYNRLILILTSRWPGPPQINFCHPI